MLRVALIGVGKWAYGGWFQTLLDGAESSLLELFVVDVEISAPERVVNDPRSHLVSYVPQGQQQTIPNLDLVVIAVPAKQHLRCIRTILPQIRHGGSLVCEKPGGNSMLEFEEMHKICQRQRVNFAISDHYLVRPTVQSYLDEGSHSTSLVENALRVRAYMLETQATGPDQNVDLDMTVHMLNLLHVLLPNSAFVPETTVQSHATSDSHVDVTYSISKGSIVVDERRIPCRIEVGKQMPEDRKEIIVESVSGKRVIDLGKAPGWRYERILREIIEGKSIACGTGHSGAIPPSISRRTWISMTQAQQQAQRCTTYEPGTLPRLTASDR